MTDEQHDEPRGTSGRAEPGVAVSHESKRRIPRRAMAKDREDYLTGVVTHDLRERIMRHLDEHEDERDRDSVTNADVADALAVDLHDVTVALERLASSGQVEWELQAPAMPGREPVLTRIRRIHWVPGAGDDG